MTNPIKSAITWFEIPTLDLAKSQAFYETVLNCTLRPAPMGPSHGAPAGLLLLVQGVDAGCVVRVTAGLAQFLRNASARLKS